MACSDSTILEQLLRKLHESHSWCPACGGEVVCGSDCILKDLWFPCPHYNTSVTCDGNLHTTACDKCDEDLSYEDCPKGEKCEPEEL